jgi:acyl-CoA hydrolase
MDGEIDDLRCRIAILEQKSFYAGLNSNSNAIQGFSKGTFDSLSTKSVASLPSDSPPEELVPMPQTRVVTNKLVGPCDVNAIGICTGGSVMSWIDITAGIAAKGLTKSPCVTASLDSIHFLRPAKNGSIMIIAAMVNRTFATSMEIGVRVEEEDPYSGTRQHCCSAYLTFVSLSAREKKTTSLSAAAALAESHAHAQLPKVYPTTTYFRQVHEDASKRRQFRMYKKSAVRRDPKAWDATRKARLHPIAYRAEDGGSSMQPTIPPAIDFSNASSSSSSSSSLCVADDDKKRPSIPPSSTSAHQTHLIMPQHANSLGITFGGQILQWIEQCAFIAGTRVARSNKLLTACMDEISFSTPTRVGDTLYVEAQVTAAFEKSMEVMVSVWGQSPSLPGKEVSVFHCGDAYSTVVLVNDAGQPQRLPLRVTAQSTEEKLRCADSNTRKESRLSLRRALLQVRRPSLDASVFG